MYNRRPLSAPKVGFLVWSLWSLGQGVDALPASDERVPFRGLPIREGST